jgi:multiple antibiotic resistance protein
MYLDFLRTALATLLVTLDPPGLGPIFLGLTLGMTNTAKRDVAFRACFIAFGILAGFALVGRTVMDALGITIPAFRIAGGFLLLYIAFDMTFAWRGERKREIATNAQAEDPARDVAAFPLAIPLMAGPASITATILLASRAGGNLLEFGALLAIVALVMALTLATFLAAERVSRVIGATANIVLTRMLGVVLAALALQFVIDGVVSVMRAEGH